MSKEVVLVTGGSGFVATHVIKLLQEKGYQVRTTIRDPKNASKVRHLKELCPSAKHEIEIVEADLVDAEKWPKAVEGCTYVIHVASPFPLESPRCEDDLIIPAVNGTLNVLKACVAAKTVKRFVYTSTTGAVYGGYEPAREAPFSEKDWVNGEDRRNSTYMRSKTLAEKAAWKFVEELPDNEKFEMAVVNPTLVLGPVFHETAGSSITIISRLLNKEYPALPQFWLPTCDVRDVAVAHYKCMTMPEAAGHRHIILTKGIWMKELADILDKEFGSQGYSIPTRVLPNPLVTLICFFNKELRESRKFSQPKTVDTSRMRQTLGITPTAIEKTILDMAYSMIENGFVAKRDKYRGPNKTT